VKQDYILIRLKVAAPRDVYVGGRRIGRHSQFGNLHAIPKAAALRLVDDGVAKLLPHLDLQRLRAEVAALELRAAA
jgi:hypothetical protein